jgi:hypothetical protein
VEDQLRRGQGLLGHGARDTRDAQLRDVLRQVREASATLLVRLEALDTAIVGFHN